MIRGIAAAASDAGSAEAAQSALAAGGSAADALVAGFLAAAGARTGVLLAPAVALVAGAGVGARVFDGRAAQPGRGAPRPRGFVDAASVPDAARVAVPRVLGLISLLHGYAGRAKLRELARTGVSAAERAGASARAALIRHVGASGAAVLQRRDVTAALLAAGGVVAGGVLTEDDLAQALPAEAGAIAVELSAGSAGDDTVTALRVPWPAGAEARTAETIVACDARGMVAALAYAPADAGIAVPELELALGRDAVPVRRGVPRLSPGTTLPAAAPIAVLLRGRFAAAVALEGIAAIDGDALDVLADRIAMESGWDATLEARLTEVREQTGAQRALAVVRDGQGGARAVTEGTPDR